MQSESHTDSSKAVAQGDLTITARVEHMLAEHRQMLMQTLPRLQQLVEDASEVVNDSVTVSDLLLLRHKANVFGSDLQRLFEREEHGLFPMLRRLEITTSISKCHAGMVKSRVKFSAREQDVVLATLTDLRELAAKQLSPNGPCEVCHGLLAVLDELKVALTEHLRVEQQELFPKSVELEESLAASPPV